MENLHSVLRRLRAAIPPGEGVLVANDLLELALVSAFDCHRAVIQILHGDDDYYYDLAARHENVIDAFVVYGATMERKLKERLPHRSADIYFLPYGLPDPPRRRTAAPGPLRLLFAGRYEHGQKGVLDLPLIDRALVERGVDVSWTMVGAGPDEEKLRDAWRNPRVNFMGRKTTAEVMDIAANHDVFVLPTRYEGVPVALIEAMSVGLAPVVSNVESGVREILTDGQTGLLPPVGDTAAFADAIATLDRNRSLLESIGEAAWRYVAVQHDVRARTDAYQALFARYRELRRPRVAGGRAAVREPARSSLDSERRGAHRAHDDPPRQGQADVAVRIVQAAGWYLPSSTGGTEVYVSELSKRLRAAGHDVLIAAPEALDQAERTYDEGGFQVYRYPIPVRVTRDEAQGTRQGARAPSGSTSGSGGRSPTSSTCTRS